MRPEANEGMNEQETSNFSVSTAGKLADEVSQATGHGSLN